MKQPTKIFIAGLAAAALVWSAGKLYTHRLEQQEAALRATCENEGAKELADLRKDLDAWDAAAPDKAPAPKVSALDAWDRASLSASSVASPNNLGIAGNHKSSAAPGKMVCDPDELSDVSTTGIQEKLVNAQRAAQASQSWPIPASLILIGIGSAPWLWYFLLRRIAELRSAISGKPPI